MITTTRCFIPSIPSSSSINTSPPDVCISFGTLEDVPQDATTLIVAGDDVNIKDLAPEKLGNDGSAAASSRHFYHDGIPDKLRYSPGYLVAFAARVWERQKLGMFPGNVHVACRAGCNRSAFVAGVLLWSLEQRRWDGPDEMIGWMRCCFARDRGLAPELMLCNPTLRDALVEWCNANTQKNDKETV